MAERLIDLEPMGIHWVRETIAKALEAYPKFSHVDINAYGNLRFIRWLYTGTTEVTISYIPYEDDVSVSYGPHNREWMKELFAGNSDNIPSDEELLDMIRDLVVWEGE